MATHLVTGYAGKEHIKSEDQGSFNASFFGTGQFVMEAGNMLEASIIDNNTVRILDGDLLMKGRHIRINPNTYEDVIIENGTAGVNRCDLIVMEYTKDETTGIENAYIKVLKGTETTGTAAPPTYTVGDILSGASFNQMPLYKVMVEGVVLTDIECLFDTKPTYETLAKKYEKEFKEACQTHLDSLGILDTMEEVEANTQANQLTGANAVKELSGQITTHIPPTISFSKVEDIDNWLNTVSDNMPNDTHYIRKFSCNVGHPVLGGGDYLLEGFKTNNNYQWQKVTSYTVDNDGINRNFERTKYAGNWGAWTDRFNDYLPLTGGTVEGTLRVDTSGVGGNACVEVASTDRTVRLIVEPDTGRAGLINATTGSWIIMIDKDNIIHFDPRVSRVVTNEKYSIAPTDAEAFNNAPIVVNADTYENESHRAGYGFHNGGMNGAFLFLDIDGRFKSVGHAGNDVSTLISSNMITVDGNEIIFEWL